MTTTIDRPATSIDWSADLDTICRTALATHRQRYTRGRERLVAALADLNRPVTIPLILAHDARLAQSSVYRNLGQLVDVGVARIVPNLIGDHAYYELAGPDHRRAYAHCFGCRTMHRLSPGFRVEVTSGDLGPVLDTMTVLVVASCFYCRRVPS